MSKNKAKCGNTVVDNSRISFKIKLKVFFMITEVQI